MRSEGESDDDGAGHDALAENGRHAMDGGGTATGRPALEEGWGWGRVERERGVCVRSVMATVQI